MIIDTSVFVTYIASGLSERFKPAGHVPMSNTLRNLGMTVTRVRSKGSC